MPKPTRIIVPMPDDLIEAVDDFRFTERVPSRSMAIRTLLRQAIERWLRAREKGEEKAR